MIFRTISQKLAATTFTTFSGVLLVGVFLLVNGGTALALETPPAPVVTPIPSPTPPPSLPSLKEVKVIKASNADNSQTRAGIGDRLLITVENLQNLINFAACRNMEGQMVPGCTKETIALFLNGREIKNLQPESGAPQTEEQNKAGTLEFHLERGLTSDEAWSDLLGNPPFNKNFFDKKNVRVSVGLENGYALNTAVEDFTLARSDNDGWFWSALALLAVLLGGVFYCAMYTNLLRDPGASPTGKVNGWVFKETKKKKQRKPYSLSRCQMAYWFLLVVGAFLFIWLFTGASDTITTTTLALVGIGAGTALGAAVIDINKTEAGSVESGILQKEESSLQTEIKELEAQISGTEKLDLQSKDPANAAKITQLTSEKTEKQNRLKIIQDIMMKWSNEVKVSEGFLEDILTDEDGGISFHRFQMFVWTLVLGILFLHSVWNRLAMPEFGTTLIALLGISAGTYLGFKIPENNTQQKP